MDEIATGKRVFSTRNIACIIIAVAFFFLSFLITYKIWTVSICGLTILGCLIFLNYKNKVKLDYLYLLILSIPVLALGTILAFSGFNVTYYSVLDRVLLLVNLLLFGAIGILMFRDRSFNFKYVIVGVLLGFLCKSLINAIINLSYLGYMPGIKHKELVHYYDGVEDGELQKMCYTLNGFEVSFGYVNSYLFYPFVSLLSILYWFKSDNRRCIFNVLLAVSSIVISIFSFLIVISKYSGVFIFIYLVLALAILLIVFINTKARFINKYFKLVVSILLGLVFIAFIFILINAQENMGAIHSFTSSNKFFNYLFNTNLYSKNMNVVLNGVFTKSKLLGFPAYFDLYYDTVCYPSFNGFVNLFMLGGIFGVLFFIVLCGLFTKSFLFVRKHDGLTSVNKNMPFFLILFIFIGLFFSGNNVILIYTCLPLFVMGGSYYYSLDLMGGKTNEK